MHKFNGSGAIVWIGPRIASARCTGATRRAGHLMLLASRLLINNIGADHGSRVYEGAKGGDLSGLAAWFRLFLMSESAQRKRFFGDGCTFCTDRRVKVYRNSLMTP
jgi:hypothetical protein